jgi:hypothetical protein
MVVSCSNQEKKDKARGGAAGRGGFLDAEYSAFDKNVRRIRMFILILLQLY